MATLIRELAIAQGGSAAGRVGTAVEAAGRTRPDDLNVRLNLFDLAVRAGTGPPRAALDQIRRIEGEDGSYWRYGRALVLITVSRRPDRGPWRRPARSWSRSGWGARRGRWCRSRWPRPSSWRAGPRRRSANISARSSSGRSDPGAIRRAARRPGTPAVRRGGTRAAELRDDGPPCRGRSAGCRPRSPSATRIMPRRLIRAEGVVSDRSEDYRDLLWLAQFRAAAGRPGGAAVPAGRRPLRGGAGGPDRPDPPPGRDRAQGPAEAALERAEEGLPRDGAILVLARGREGDRPARSGRTALPRGGRVPPPGRPGRFREAATFYLRIGRPAKAEPLLKRVIDADGGPAEATWARRLLATLVGGNGGHVRALRALEILDPSDRPGAVGRPDEASTSPEDLQPPGEDPGAPRRAGPGGWRPPRSSTG